MIAHTAKADDLYIKAVITGHQIHQGQKYGDQAYTVHLTHVERVMTRFQIAVFPYSCAAWLHDGLEDTDLSEDELLNAFGQEVFQIVYAVTDGAGENRKQRKEQSFARMAEHPAAIPMKLGDRIANVEFCVFTRDKGKWKMYKKEYPAFRERLYETSRGAANEIYHVRIQEMWDHLDNLMEHML